MAILAAIAGAAIGALVTLLVKHRLDRGVETRAARRELYVDLLTMLHAGKRVIEHTTFAVDDPVPDLVEEDRIDAFNARLDLDASAEMRSLVAACFHLLQRFNVSRLMGVPVDVDDVGMFRHRWDLVAGQAEEVRLLQMRIAIGRISDEYRAAFDEITSQVRQEVHAAR